MKRVFSLLLVVLLLMSALPFSAMAESKRTVYISSTGEGTLNLRAGPGKDYDVKGYVYHGDRVTPVDRSGIWSKVRTDSGRTGWIKTKYIDGTTRELGTGTKTVRTNGGSLNLRSGPGTGYGIRSSVWNGARVKVINTEDNWVKVTVQSNGETGWILAKYVCAGSSTPDPKPTPSGSTKKVCHVTASSLNVRTGAGSGYSWKDTLYQSQAFKVLETSGNWYKIQTFGGVTGWISKTYTAADAQATVTAVSLNMRTEAGTSGSVIKSLSSGTRVTVHSVTGNWARITSGGRTGYVSLNYLRF